MGCRAASVSYWTALASIWVIVVPWPHLDTRPPKEPEGTGRGREGTILHAAEHPETMRWRLGAQPWHLWMRSLWDQAGRSSWGLYAVFVPRIMLLLISELRSTFKKPYKFNPLQTTCMVEFEYPQYKQLSSVIHGKQINFAL